MNYKYRKWQIFGKRLDVPEHILESIYKNNLTFSNYMKYDLENKVPISCIISYDKELVEKFGVDKCKKLDWELINHGMLRVDYGFKFPGFRALLMSEDENKEPDDLNKMLYETVIDHLSPSNFSSKMREVYPDRFFDVSQVDETLKYIADKFNNNRNLGLFDIVKNWDLFKEKDLSYFLSHDSTNEPHITDNQLKKFMSNYGGLAPIILDKLNGFSFQDLYRVIDDISKFNSDEEKQNYVKQITDKILDKERKNFGKINNFTDEECNELFKYSSLKDYLNGSTKYDVEKVIDELKLLPQSYSELLPFNVLNNENSLSFLSDYGVKNVVDFDNECGHFFSKNNFEVLKTIDKIYHYGPKTDIPYFEKKGEIYTKDEFYQIMRRFLAGYPDGDNKPLDYRHITGEFRTKNPDLFISEQAPQELQDLFYSKSITPKLLLNNPSYIEFLKDKFACYFKFDRDIFQDENQNFFYFFNILNNKLEFSDFIAFITEYEDVFDIVFNKEPDIRLSIDDNINQITQKLNDTCIKVIIERGIKYPEHIHKELVKSYPSMFLDSNAPQELQEMFYNRSLSTEYLLANPALIKYLKNVNLEVLFKYMPLCVKNNNHNDFMNIINYFNNLFSSEEVFSLMILYGKYIENLFNNNKFDDFKFDLNFSKEELLSELDRVILKNIIESNLKYDENIADSFKANNPNMFLDNNTPEEIKKMFYDRSMTIEYLNSHPEVLNYFNNTNISFGFSEEYSWIIPAFNDMQDIKLANHNYLKVISEYAKLFDIKSQSIFREYIINFGSEINVEKVEYHAKILIRLSLSNSSEISAFADELAKQILCTDKPFDALNKIEEMFVKNNIPVVGKIYSCFEILHPDFQGFDFNNSIVSPVLKNASTSGKKVIVFSDLIKCAFGSNNRSVNNYLKNIEIGSSLYEKIKNGHLQFDSLSESDMKELITFRNHLATLYNNTKKSKSDNKTFTISKDILNDILQLVKELSSDDTLDYNLADRVIRMFCGFAGINTLEEAKSYISNKISVADSRNRNAARLDLILEKGDFIKGIGSIDYLSNILQNGSVSKEYLGASAGSDSTPLDTDVSMVLKSDGSVSDKMEGLIANNYGPIWFVLKNDDRFITTRNNSEELDVKRNLSKLEVFHTLSSVDHYGIRTGFASSEINYILTNEDSSKIGLEIAMNGFYIPVANKKGEIVFTPKDYDNLREKMSGLSHFGENNYSFSENLVTNETIEFTSQIEQSNLETQEKRNKINSIIKKSLEELGLHLKTKIDGDLTEGVVELIDTGSTGRGTNKPGDGDFDFMMRLDKSIISGSQKVDELKRTILKNLGKENSSEIIASGDFRLKGVQIDNDTNVDIDITFTNKTDKISYSTEMALQDRLSTIKNLDTEKYNLVVANILLAKQVLKKAEVYKPNRGEVPQGGLGGVGIENWILQNGGSFIDAATSFVKAAEGKNFAEFKSAYQIWDFGENHLAERRNQYSHDNFIANNMNESGYNKMTQALKNYLKSLDKEQIQSKNIQL